MHFFVKRPLFRLLSSSRPRNIYFKKPLLYKLSLNSYARYLEPLQCVVIEFVHASKYLSITVHFALLLKYGVWVFISVLFVCLSSCLLFVLVVLRGPKCLSLLLYFLKYTRVFYFLNLKILKFFSILAYGNIIRERV